jgi:hypothetical protein
VNSGAMSALLCVCVAFFLAAVGIQHGGCHPLPRFCLGARCPHILGALVMAM